MTHTAEGEAPGALWKCKLGYGYGYGFKVQAVPWSVVQQVQGATSRLTREERGALPAAATAVPTATQRRQ